MLPALRLPIAVVGLLLACYATPAMGLGGGEYVPPGEYCPTYKVDTGEGAARAQVSAADPWGAAVVTAGRYYVIEDTFYVNALGEPYLFSLWLYEETNGMAGLQRGDEVCFNTPPGVEPDVIMN